MLNWDMTALEDGEKHRFYRWFGISHFRIGKSRIERWTKLAEPKEWTILNLILDLVKVVRGCVTKSYIENNKS